MSYEKARATFESGRCHGMAADLLYRATLAEGRRRKAVKDPYQYAFNGPMSLSIHYLVGLSLELMLKAAISAHFTEAMSASIPKTGHDLVDALAQAEKAGFVTNAPMLKDIVAALNEPYKEHWFRYGDLRVEDFTLPSDFQQVHAALTVLDEELSELLWTNEERAALKASVESESSH